MTFDKLCKVFLIEEPFYGIILSSLDKIPTNQIDTLGVGRSGNTFKLWYNPDFVGKWDDDTVRQLFKHEVLHLCLEHPFIGEKEGLYDNPHTQKLYNIACDLEVNCYLDRSKMQKEVGGCWCEDLGYEKSLGSLAYYRKLKQDPNFQLKENKDPDSPCNGGLGGILLVDKDGNILGTIDDHGVWPKKTDAATMQSLKLAVEELVSFAAEEVEKHQGTVPGELTGLIERIRKKPRPVADWKKYCRRYLGNEYTYLTKKSRRRESLRFPDAAGTRHIRKARILVAIDTSGSVSMPEYKEFMGQIMTMKEKANFRVLECDAKIQYEYEFNGKIHDKLHGGGGTSFQPVVDYFNNNKREYDCLVYFTDGGAGIPEDTPKDTLWVISSKGDHNRERYKVNGAHSVFIPKQQQED